MIKSWQFTKVCLKETITVKFMVGSMSLFWVVEKYKDLLRDVNVFALNPLVLDSNWVWYTGNFQWKHYVDSSMAWVGLQFFQYIHSKGPLASMYSVGHLYYNPITYWGTILEILYGTYLCKRPWQHRRCNHFDVYFLS